MAATKPVHFSELLKDAPKNWGRWGANDEIGALNFLTSAEVLRGVRAVKSGKVFTLGVPVARPQGDPLYPSRSQPIRTMARDKGHYIARPGDSRFPGGLEYADDVIIMYLQGTTQYDALGHVWYGDKLYNGYDAKTTIGGLQKCSIEPIAEHGVVGRGVLLDVGALQGQEASRSERADHARRPLAAAKKQNSPIEKHDILLIHTGWLKRFYDEGLEGFFPKGGSDEEPGLGVQRGAGQWFHEMEIPSIGSDTIATEQTCHRRERHDDPAAHGAAPLPGRDLQRDRLAARSRRGLRQRRPVHVPLRRRSVEGRQRRRLAGQPDRNKVGP